VLAAWISVTIPASAQSSNQWFGWAQCSIDVQGAVMDGNGTILGQYLHQETQTWEMTGAAPTGNIYPAKWTVNGSGWNTAVTGGRTWTVNGTVSSAPLRAMQRASDNAWMIDLSPHWQLTPRLATITPSTPSPVTAEFGLPTIFGGPQDVSIFGSTTIYDSAGKLGVLQPGGPASQITCRWRFGKGFTPPPPPAQVSIPATPPSQKPPAAPPGSVFVPLPPCRLVDTRTAQRGFRLSIGFGIFPTSPATFQVGGNCGVPALGATAVSMNITAVPIEPLSGMSLRPVGQGQAPLQLLSATDGQPTANAAILPFGSGAVEVSVTNRSHVIIDVNGFFVPAIQQPQGLAFYPIKSCRAIHTWNPTSGGALAAATIRDLPVRTTCNLPANAGAYVLNLTVMPKNGFLGFIQTWATGQTRPATSTINASDGQIKANMAIVQAGTNGAISLYSSDTTDMIVDVVGFFAPQGAPGALTFQPLAAPCTAADTQGPNGPFGGPALDAQMPREFPIAQSPACAIPTWARAYAVNFTVAPLAGGPLTGLVAQPTGPGYFPSWMLFALDGQVTASAGVIYAGTGSLTISAFNPTHLAIGVYGFFD
jgi:hypothetical protein